MMKRYQWNNLYIFFKTWLYYSLLWTVLVLIQNIDNLLYMGPMFSQRWMYHLTNMKLMNCLLFDWVTYIFFAWCLSGNRYWCSVNIVLNITLVKRSHLGFDGVSSTLVFVAEILVSKTGLQTKTNLNTFIWS